MASHDRKAPPGRILLGLGLMAGLTALGTGAILQGLPASLPPPPQDARLPMLAKSLDLAQGATLLSGAVSPVLLARSAAELDEARRRARQAEERLTNLLRGMPHATGAVHQGVSALAGALRQLGDALAREYQARQAAERQNAAVMGAHRAFRATLNTAIEEVGRDIARVMQGAPTARTEPARPRGLLANNEIPRQAALLRARSAAEELFGIANRIMNLRDDAQYQALMNSQGTALNALRAALQSLGDLPRYQALRDAANGLQAAHTAFEAPSARLAEAEAAGREVAAAAARLGDAATGFQAGMTSALAAAAEEARRAGPGAATSRPAQFWPLMLGLLALALAAGAAAFVLRGRQSASGQAALPPDDRRADRNLAAELRADLLTMTASRDKAMAELAALQQRHDAVWAEAEAGLRADIEPRLASLTASAATSRATLQGMEDAQHSTSMAAETIAASATRARDETGKLATTAEQLTATVLRVSEQIRASAGIAAQAVEDAGRTDTIVQGLSGAAEKIGDVVKLISAIAGQTNLLALNATIEAARAGDAGKGFAVVASEVKALATQTAKATEEISRQVQEIRGTSTEAAAAIQGIAAVVQRIDTIAAEAAQAIEEQGAATREMTQSIAEASAGTIAVADAVIGLRKGMEAATAPMAGLAQHTVTMAAAGESLQRDITQVFDKLRAA